MNPPPKKMRMGGSGMTFPDWANGWDGIYIGILELSISLSLASIRFWKRILIADEKRRSGKSPNSFEGFVKYADY